MKGQPSSGHVFYARLCVRRDYPSEAIEIVSGKLGIGEIPFHHQVMPGDIDIQDHRYRMSRRTFFILLMHYVRGFACTWMALRARNPSPRGRATLNHQSTCRGPRPGPTLAPSVRAGSLRATEQRARDKTRGRKRKNAEVPKTHIYR